MDLNKSSCCRATLKSAHPSWGVFKFCVKCGEIDHMWKTVDKNKHIKTKNGTIVCFHDAPCPEMGIYVAK